MLKTLREEVESYGDEISRDDLTFYDKMWSIYKKYNQGKIAISGSKLQQQDRSHVLFELGKLENLLAVVTKQTNYGGVSKLPRRSPRVLDEILAEMQRVETLMKCYLLAVDFGGFEFEKTSEKWKNGDVLLAELEVELLESVKQFKNESKNRIETRLAQLEDLMKH